MAMTETDENGNPINTTRVSLKPVVKMAPTADRGNTARDSFGAFPDQSAKPNPRWKKGD